MSHSKSAYPGKSHDVVAILRDGRVIAYGSECVNALADVLYETVIYFPDLKRVEYVLQIQYNSVGKTFPVLAAPMNKYIIGNEVHLTIKVAAGATVCVDAIAIGPP